MTSIRYCHLSEPMNFLLGSVQCTTCSVANHICQEGQSERTFPIFAFSSRFFLSFPIFPVDCFRLLFPDFWQIFRCQGWYSAPWTPSGYARWLRHWSSVKAMVKAEWPLQDNGESGPLCLYHSSLKAFVSDSKDRKFYTWPCTIHKSSCTQENHVLGVWIICELRVTSCELIVASASCSLWVDFASCELKFASCEL